MSPRQRTWRDMRIEAGLTLRQLETLSGLNRGEISRIERGRGCATPDHALALLAVLQGPLNVERLAAAMINEADREGGRTFDVSEALARAERLATGYAALAAYRLARRS